MSNKITKNSTNEQDVDQEKWIVKVEHVDPDGPSGELCIRLPVALMEQLSWEIGDEIEWKETEICEQWGEHMGCILSNLTKNPKETL
jgi:hypothetical protein